MAKSGLKGVRSLLLGASDSVVLRGCVPPGIQGWSTKKNTKVAAIIPTMTKTIVGLAKLVLLSGGVTDGSMGDWMLVGA
jgi:hypothetical protein